MYVSLEDLIVIYRNLKKCHCHYLEARRYADEAESNDAPEKKLKEKFQYNNFGTVSENCP